MHLVLIFSCFRWRKEPYRLREYDRIDNYVAASCVDKEDGEWLQSQLDTTLDGYLGPAYNFDDRGLTEEWMLNFRDGQADPPSEDDVIRTQMECLMEILVGKVQDKVCNDMRVLDRELVGLGPMLKEKPVWGIDCNTNRTLELILEEAFERSCDSDDGGNQLKYSKALFKRFIERVLLPAMNAVPSSQAHKMEKVLEYIIKVWCPFKIVFVFCITTTRFAESSSEPELLLPRYGIRRNTSHCGA